MTEEVLKSKRMCWSIVGAIALIGLTLCYTFQSKPVAVVAPVSQVLIHETVDTITAPVQVYKPATKAKLKLPEKIQADGTQVVLTASDLPASKFERTVSSVLDTTTGETTQYIENKPLPLFASASTGSIGVYGGLKNLDPAIRVEFKQDLFSVKSVKVGAIASVDVTASRTDTFVGVGGRWEW